MCRLVEVLGAGKVTNQELNVLAYITQEMNVKLMYKCIAPHTHTYLFTGHHEVDSLEVGQRLPGFLKSLNNYEND